jgi:hypothetical protein
MSVKKLPAAVARRLAVKASCCPNTIQKVYQGQPVRGLALYRALAALMESNIAPLKPDPESAPVLSIVPPSSEGDREGGHP